MSVLLADLALGIGGNGNAHVLEGWAEPEASHRWTIGRESRLRLAIDRPGPDCVLVLTATPCLHPPSLTAQMVMLAVDGRLLATMRIAGLHTMALALPAGLPRTGGVLLSFSHLSQSAPRPPAQMREGEPLGLMVHSVRVFRLTVPAVRATSRGRAAASPMADRAALAARFESLGQGCQFGLVQRWCGAEPLGLLRFVDTTTSMLVDGLVAGFAGVDDPAQLSLNHTEDAEPRFAWRQRRYGLTYDTRLKVGGIGPARLLHSQARRLGFLRRKLLEDIGAAEKIFVLTRGDCLAEHEAMAVYCALRLHGDATLLWTVFGAPEAAGNVERLRPGFLRGHLGAVDRHGYGSRHAWIAVMQEALNLIG